MDNIRAKNVAADIEFIRLVQGFPVLYDKELSRGSKNVSLKNDAWQEIAENVGKSEIACITRWKSIRDRFGKEYRRQQENPKDTTNWELFRHCMFLMDHYKQGTVRPNESIENIKYEPKTRKRKHPSKSVADISDEDCLNSSNNKDELDPEEIEFDQQLIDLVQQHEVLYDRKMVRDSKNLAAKNEAWSIISQTLGVLEEVCYKRWKKIRDRFSREYRNSQLFPEKPITWIYFEQLRFLESHYRKGIPLPVEDIKRKLMKVQKIETAKEEDPWGNEEDITGAYYSENENEYFDGEQAFNDFLLLPTTSSTKVSVVTNTTTTTNTSTPIQIAYIPQGSTECIADISHLNNNVGVGGGGSNNSQPQSLNNTMTIIQEEEVEEVEVDANGQSSSSHAIDPEIKLTTLVSNLEGMLRQSQDCLKSVRQQKQKHNEELEKQQHVIQLDLQPGMLSKVHLLLDGLESHQRSKAEKKILQFLCECQIKALNNEDVDDISPAQFY